MKALEYQKIVTVLSVLLSILTSCSKDNATLDKNPKLIFKFKFNPNQERLGNFGEPKPIPQGHAAQTPTFNLMGAHYIELAEENDIPAYNGTQVYESPVTSAGGSEAIDFDQALYVGDGEVFYETDLKNVTPGAYQFLRVSLSYQNYTIAFRTENMDFTGTIASFVGANTYIKSFHVKNQTVMVNGNKLQGYWAFETDMPNIPVIEGQAPANATTVPNPISEFSPIPPGSCLVTGEFVTPFEITGKETKDVVIECSISINHSFEWVDNNANGTFEPTEGDTVFDMGVRGLIPKVQE